MHFSSTAHSNSSGGFMRVRDVKSCNHSESYVYLKWEELTCQFFYGHLTLFRNSSSFITSTYSTGSSHLNEVHR